MRGSRGLTRRRAGQAGLRKLRLARAINRDEGKGRRGEGAECRRYSAFQIAQHLATAVVALSRR